MVDTSFVVELCHEELMKGSVYTRLYGAMVSKNQAENCIKQAYLQGMLKMWDMVQKGEDFSDLFQHYVPKGQFVKIP